MTVSVELHDASHRYDDATAEVPANSRSPVPDGLAVQTLGLAKRFGLRAALDDVDLEVPRGCAFGLLGPNGAGKTTLIRLLLGLAAPTAGRMRLLGRELPSGSADALARVGAIIEEPRFHPHLSGRENLAVHAAARERAAYARIDGALARVGLTVRADERVKTSQGRLDELTAGGPRAIDITCSHRDQAASLLSGMPGIAQATDHAGSLRVELGPEAPTDREVVSELLRRLLDAGFSIERVSPVAVSLEQRFLTMTTRLEDRS